MLKTAEGGEEGVLKTEDRGEDMGETSLVDPKAASLSKIDPSESDEPESGNEASELPRFRSRWRYCSRREIPLDGGAGK